MMEVDENCNNNENVRKIQKFHQCQKCDFKTKRKNNLTRHMIVHLSSRTPNKERICLHCKHEFPAYKLKKHIKWCNKPLPAVFSKELTLQMLRTTNISIRDVRKAYVKSSVWYQVWGESGQKDHGSHQQGRWMVDSFYHFVGGEEREASNKNLCLLHQRSP